MQKRQPNEKQIETKKVDSDKKELWNTDECM